MCLFFFFCREIIATFVISLSNLELDCEVSHSPSARVLVPGLRPRCRIQVPCLEAFSRVELLLLCGPAGRRRGCGHRGGSARSPHHLDERWASISPSSDSQGNLLDCTSLCCPSPGPQAEFFSCGKEERFPSLARGGPEAVWESEQLSKWSAARCLPASSVQSAQLASAD